MSRAQCSASEVVVEAGPVPRLASSATGESLGSVQRTAGWPSLRSDNWIEAFDQQGLGKLKS